jgi:hypothetical protein
MPHDVGSASADYAVAENDPIDSVAETTIDTAIAEDVPTAAEAVATNVDANSADASSSSETVEQAVDNANIPALVLTDIASNREICVETPRCILGREGDIANDIFTPEVSRQHMQLDFSNGIWKATHLGSNPSVLFEGNTRIPLPRGIAVPIQDGDMILMANQRFTIKIEVPQQPTTAKTSDASTASGTTGGQDVQNLDASPDPNLVEGWFITCRKCGKVFQVADGGSRIGQCPDCIDIMDKMDIATVSAVHGFKRKGEFEDVR